MNLMKPVMPKGASGHEGKLCPSDDELNIEVAEFEDQHSSTSTYIFNPRLKASVIACQVSA